MQRNSLLIVIICTIIAHKKGMFVNYVSYDMSKPQLLVKSIMKENNGKIIEMANALREYRKRKKLKK